MSIQRRPWLRLLAAGDGRKRRVVSTLPLQWQSCASRVAVRRKLSKMEGWSFATAEWRVIRRLISKRLISRATSGLLKRG